MEIDLGNGYRAEIETEQDIDMGPPWKEHDGHGIVSEWATRDKAPGERVLAHDGRHKRYYDVAGTILIAKRDGWGVSEYDSRGSYIGPKEFKTKGAKAAAAVEHDFEHLRRWCADQWCWIGVQVKVFRGDEEIGSDSLWGVESEGNYWKEIGEDMARAIAESDLKKRQQTWRNALFERREARAWAERDVRTV